MLLTSEKNEKNSDNCKGPIYITDNEIPDTSIVNSVMKETINDDKIMDTSMTPLSKTKENKKPKYSQVNTKIHSYHQTNHQSNQSSSKLNKKVQIAVEETNPSNNLKKKKKLVYKPNFIEYVEIESYKRFNKAMTYPDIPTSFVDPDDTEDMCKKCKECFDKTCLIF